MNSMAILQSGTPSKLAILSGKGGTGKTFVATNLASVMGEVFYVDCDVEEPNGSLFLHPEQESVERIEVTIPRVNQEKCSGCRLCVDTCKFNAIALVQDKAVVLEDMCHSCGACFLVCPKGALVSTPIENGVIRTGISNQIHVLTGEMLPGKESGEPILHALLKKIENPPHTVIMDCPPGTGCLVTECVREADYCMIVTEPTLFGFHDFLRALDLVHHYKKPFGILINKWLNPNNQVEEYALAYELPIIAKIPFEKKVSRIYSTGELVTNHDSKYRIFFQNLANYLFGK